MQNVHVDLVPVEQILESGFRGATHRDEAIRELEAVGFIGNDGVVDQWRYAFPDNGRNDTRWC